MHNGPLVLNLLTWALIFCDMVLLYSDVCCLFLLFDTRPILIHMQSVGTSSFDYGKVFVDPSVGSCSVDSFCSACANQNDVLHLTNCDMRLSILLQSKLKVYLAPFLHGMRYTSFGRHFTKVDKLEEVCSLYTCSKNVHIVFASVLLMVV